MHDYCEKCSSNANETSGKNSSNSKKMYRKLPIYNLQLNLRLKILQFARIQSKSKKKTSHGRTYTPAVKSNIMPNATIRKCAIFLLQCMIFLSVCTSHQNTIEIAAAHHFFPAIYESTNHTINIVPSIYQAFSLFILKQ